MSRCEGDEGRCGSGRIVASSLVERSFPRCSSRALQLPSKTKEISACIWGRLQNAWRYPSGHKKAEVGEAVSVPSPFLLSLSNPPAPKKEWE